MANITETPERKHNTAETSRRSFIELTNEGRQIEQKKIIFQSIKENQPVTSRRLSILTNQERSSVCRSLYDLLNEMQPQIKVCFVAPCPITNRKVKWYSLIDWQSEKENSTCEN